LRRNPSVGDKLDSKPFTKTKVPCAAEVGAGFGEGFALKPAQPANKTSSARIRMGMLRAEVEFFIGFSTRGRCVPAGLGELK
jgi:hypothetical protein